MPRRLYAVFCAALVIFSTLLGLPVPAHAASCPAELADGVVDADYTFSAADTYDCSSVDLVINTTKTLTFPSTISGSGPTATGSGTTLSVNSLTINGTGKISADAKGFTGGLNQGDDGNGPGGGISESTNGHQGGGGGYGGKGGNGTTAALNAGGSTYGSFTNPVSLGSGGGSGYTGGDGGTGGGAIKIISTAGVTISGTISSNGSNGTAASGFGAGGGSGGSIIITAATITVNAGATISANGGNGGGADAGSGGGGRIVLSYSSTFSNSGTISATYGGTGIAGVNGTYLLTKSDTNDLYINTSQTWYASSSLEGPTHTYNSVTIDGNSTLTVLGDTSTGNGHTFNVTSFEIKSGSTLSANAGGYEGGAMDTSGSDPPSCDPASGGTTHATLAGGGGYGGKGATGTAAGGATCGSFTSPSLLGSGGGGAHSAAAVGGNGGGLITITASGTTTISGTISANGGNGSVVSNTYKGGGGSGGGIYITTNLFAGSGTISANGGDRGGDGAGGGGGGRIALKYASGDPFAGTVTATVGAGGTSGENGTVIHLDTTTNDLLVKNSQTWRASASLEGPTHTYNDITINNNSTLSLNGDTTNGNGFTFNVYSLTLESGSTISGNALGYTGGAIRTNGNGDGAGTTTGLLGTFGSGAGHGGIGGGTGGGPAYDSPNYNPVKLGSGGSGGYNTGATGGTGGSAVIFYGTGPILIQGTITMDGSAGATGESTTSGGGGSGGTINLRGSNITVDAGALVSADGGGSGMANGGCGAGGKIAITYSDTNVISGTMTVDKGTGCTGGEDGIINYQGWPVNPTADQLHQYKYTAGTELSTGGVINEASITLKILDMNDGAATEILTPEVEVRTVGTAFTDTATTTGDAVNFSGSAVDGVVNVTSGFSDLTQYHWQARFCNSLDECTIWVSYGGNAESATDFSTLLNQDPNAPTLTSIIDGSYTRDSTPTLSFTLSDPDTSDTVKYTIQIDDTSNFSSPVVTYTSDLTAQGSVSYTPTTVLDDGSYYWRVKTIDSSNAESAYSTANSGNVAFIVDATIPDTTSFSLESPGDGDYTNSERPTFKWKVGTDSGSGTSKYLLYVNNGDSGSFSIDNISPTSASDVDTATYHIDYDSSYISVYTKSSSSWTSAQNDGRMKEGKRSWTVSATDNAGNQRQESRTLNVDLSAPSVEITSLTYSSSQVSVGGRVTDTKHGTSVEKNDYVRSNPSKVDLELHEVASKKKYVITIDLTKTCTYTDTTSDSLSCSFSYEFNHSFSGSYFLTANGGDKAGNGGSTTTVFEVSDTSETDELPVCQTRPACLDATPACMIRTPIGGWCEPVATPGPEPCISRPTCLDAIPACKIPEPVDGWCPEPSPAPVDQTAIYDVQVEDITTRSARITWLTNEPATSKVNYGLSRLAENSRYSLNKTMNHDVLLDNLPANTEIYFEVISEGTTTATDAYRVFKTGSESTGIEKFINEIQDKLLGDAIAVKAAEVSSATTGIAAGAAASVLIIPMFSGMAQMPTLHSIWESILNFINSMLASLGIIRRRKKSIGVVFDALSGKGIDGACVIFRTATGSSYSAISNRDGRYTLSLTPGLYTVFAKKGGYKMPDDQGAVNSQGYDPVYSKNTAVKITTEPFANLAIPLVPLGTKNSIHALLRRLLNRYFYPIITVSLAISGYAAFLIPTLLNRSAFGILVASLVGHVVTSVTKSRSWGVVLYAEGYPLKNLTMQLYQEQDGAWKLFSTQITDQEGRYLFTPENGTYNLHVLGVGKEMLYSKKYVVNNRSPKISDKIIIYGKI